MRNLVLSSVVVFATAVAAPSRGQDETAGTGAATDSAATDEVEIAAPSAERQAFDAAFAAVKEAYRAIEALQTEYQTADSGRQETIQQELRDLGAQTQPKVDAMVDEALKLFRAEPMADQKITDLLLSVAEHRVVGRGPGGGGDQYESALPILDALIEAGHEQPQLTVWAALCAIATNDFDAAAKHAAAAKESGALSGDPGDSEEAQEAFGLASRWIAELGRFRKRWEAEAPIRAAEAEADDLPRVKMTTSKGDLVIELFENEAPVAVANFVTLVKDGFYDGVVFHRVLPRFMAQGGDPTGSGSGGPGYSIPCECYEPNTRKHFRGSLSMAHAGRDTGGSQFFLCFGPTDHLDGRHTVFGRVIEGLEVLGELQRIDPGKPGPDPDRIVTAVILRDRGHEYDFTKLPGR